MNLPSAPSRFETGSLLQVLLSLFGLLISLSGAAGLLLLVLFSASMPGLQAGQYAGQFISLAWILLFLGLLCIPSLAYSLLRLLHKTAALTVLPGFPIASAALLLWPVLLLAGFFLAKMDGVGTYLLPLITILVTALPLWWLIELVRRGIPISPQRSWGTLIFALFFSNPLTMLLEAFLLLGLAITAGLLIGANGYFLARLQNLYQQVLQAGGDPERIQQILLPLLSNPWVILAGVVLMSGLIPLLEELCKSLPVWSLLGRKLSPGEGLVIGAIAGAGFALTESLTSLSNPSIQAQWLVLVIGRVGTGLLHITASGLVGMGLAAAWRSGKFHYFGLALLSAVMLHGLWNFFSLSAGLATTVLQSPSAGQVISFIALGGMAALAVLSISFLLIANQRVRPAPQSSPGAPPPTENLTP